MKKINSLALILLSILIPTLTFAQNTEVEMSDIMHINGKIYVVVGVISIIFVGILVYLFMIDRKVRILEKNINK